MRLEWPPLADTVATARAALDEAAFRAAWAAGRALPFEQALAYALEPQSRLASPDGNANTAP